MHQNVPPAHFGYMATGIDDEVTLRANREGFLKFQLRPRRMIDVETLDLRMELFGQTYPSPIVLAPTGVQQGLPRRRRARRRARRPQGRSPADALDRGHDLDRAGDRGARPAGVVPALSDEQVGSGRGPGAARREGRRANHRGDGRRAGPAELGDPGAAAGAPTRAIAARAMRSACRASSSASPTSTGSTSPASPAPAPPTSPGSSSSACATR